MCEQQLPFTLPAVLLFYDLVQGQDGNLIDTPAASNKAMPA